jgi:molybdopterin-containing oxidoreductase family iron-sulfur binding subunit
MSNNDPHIDVASIDSRLRSKKGQEYWRSLEEIADTPAFQEYLHREFPASASEWTDAVGRRKFLKLMGASLALAGLTACTRQPTEQIAPYVRQPEGLTPGQPLFFATAMTLNGSSLGLLVESHEGRPTKIEGNPDHPASLGAANAFAQAAILSLYDPDRSQTVTYIGEDRPYSSLLGAIRRELVAQKGNGGAGLRILTEHVTSPTLAAQIKSLLAEYPSAKWHQYEPAARDNAREGARLAFGQAVNTIYRFDRADVILSLDADFLAEGPTSVRYAKDFAAKRRLAEGNKEMSRLYTVECTPSITGAKSDHRLPMKGSEIENFALSVAAGLAVATGRNATQTAHQTWIDGVVKNLKEARGKSIVIAGDHQPPFIHALAHAINSALGNVGQTVVYTDPIEANPVDGIASIRELVNDMNAGRVDVLLIVGGNPVYDAPADLDFKKALGNVRVRIHSSLHQDETSEYCQWHVPEAHFLESWSDTRAFDGTASIVQPLIAPLYNGKTQHEVLAAFSDQPERTSYQIVRDYWKAQLGGSDQEFEKRWRRALHDGVIVNTAFAEKTVALKADWFAGAIQPRSSEKYEIVFRPDPTIYDGRFANNGWLQELAKTFTSLTWDNAALISPATARALGLESKPGKKGGDYISDQIEIQHEGRTIKAPVWIMPGQPDDCITLHLGYGRTRAGRVGNEAGFDAYRIRTSAAPWNVAGAQVKKANDTFTLATTQLHHLLEGRDIVRSGSLEHYHQHPDLAPEHHGEHKPLSLYPGYKYDGYAWGMAIDLNACVGCSACVVACQSENNIPIVGKEQVERGREMHWLRIDTYYKGGEANPETYFQPVPCMHCENAPCEVVCPVAATVHSAEGLNDMVYNRCVGTRYCSNNCPYKVRRFNYLLYQDFETAPLKLGRNPEVTVRSRGVMEKCTYCVQRIQAAKITAEKEDRQVRDDEIKTACQQTCPTDAIVFGNINDPQSRVAKLKREPRNYSLLAELNTNPRTTYLGAVRNTNDDLEKA